MGEKRGLLPFERKSRAPRVTPDSGMKVNTRFLGTTRKTFFAGAG